MGMRNFPSFFIPIHSSPTSDFLLSRRKICHFSLKPDGKKGCTRIPVKVGPIATTKPQIVAHPKNRIRSRPGGRGSTTMASSISSVTKSSTESTGLDTGQSGELERLDPRSTAENSPTTRARELVWLDDVRRGYSIKEIARREGLGRRRIQHGVARARERAKSSHPCELHSSNELCGRDRGITADAGRAVRDDSNRPPRLVPLFPIGVLTPGSACPHHGPIRAGSVYCCMVCSQSGVDDHPALKRDPRTDPRSEHRAVAPVRVAGVRETRRQRRQRLNTARQAGLNMAAVTRKDPARPPLRPMSPNP